MLIGCIYRKELVHPHISVTLHSPRLWPASLQQTITFSRPCLAHTHWRNGTVAVTMYRLQSQGGVTAAAYVATAAP